VAKIKKYNLSGAEVGDVEVDERFINAEANGQMIKDYIVALRANARQWSASTKTRGEVKHTTKKPHPQKGQGRARQGSLVAPQYRGGGRAFGPRPKFDQHIKINQKEKRAAIRFLIGEKLREGKVWVLDNAEMSEPRTKTVVNFLDTLNISGRVLFLEQASYVTMSMGDQTIRASISSGQHLNFSRSIRNIPRTSFSLAPNISGYDVLVAREIVMTESALNELNQWLNG